MPRPTLLVVCAVALSACHKPEPVRSFDASQAMQAVETQVAFGPRIPGTPAHEREGDWLDSLLRQRSDTLLVQRWNHVTAKGDTLRLRNFIARFNPAATHRVLFMAHWDTRPTADGPNSKDSTAAVPGADDGASGAAVLLGVASVLHRAPPKPDLGVDLLFEDGEDYGSFNPPMSDVLIGARYYAGNVPPPGPPRWAVLLDMVGDRNLNLYQETNSVTGAPDLVTRVWNTAREQGYAQFFIPTPKYNLIDDHVELQKAGIPAIDVVDFDYPYWHTPDDTPDKVSGASMAVVGNVALALIRKEKP